MASLAATFLLKKSFLAQKMVKKVIFI